MSRDLRQHTQDTRALAGFLETRLVEDLARCWDRPGAPALVAVVDDLLGVLRSGRLPERRELRILLYGYSAHPDYERSWERLLDPAGYT